MRSETNFQTLWKLMAGQRRRYCCALLAMFSGVGLLYITPLITRSAIDGVIDPHLTSPAAKLVANIKLHWGAGPALAIVATVLVIVTIASAACTAVQGRLSGVASETIIRRLRNRLFAHLQHLPMPWHDKSTTGDIVQRCTSDVDTVRLFYTNQVIEIARSSFRILLGVPILLWIDWKMALIATAVMPAIIGFAVVFFRRVQGTFKQADVAEGGMTAALQENLTGIRVVRAFARQEFEIERFTKRNAEYRDRQWGNFRVMAVYWSTSDFMCFVQFAAIVFAGAWRAANGSMSIGTMIAFVSYAQMFIWPVREIGRTLTELGKTLVSIERIKEILEAAEETNPMPTRETTTDDTPKPATTKAAAFSAFGPGPVRGDLELRNVSFRHGQHWVLRDVTLSIPAGSTLALLGPSGSGKTTLVNLLLRLYDYDEGSITLDGVEIKSLDRKALRSQFAAVLQEPFLYSKTLRENIKLGRHTAADEEMVIAARAAAIHESIESFDHKYDTMVGERGVTLSGGQRQRTAIARALLKDAPIVILDDALSAVDTSTELSILDQLRSRRGRHTTILIAHRLSTLMHADQIAVLEHGRIVQRGNHEQLSQQEGLYKKLWEIQGALAEELDAETAAPSHESPVSACSGEE